jgi:formamidopyrimidine-DNA glycosylase
VWWSGHPLRLKSAVDLLGLRRACKGAELISVRRRAKYLLLDWERGPKVTTVLVHLGMTGRLLVSPAATPRPAHTHVVWILDDGRELRFIDPRRFGVVRAVATSEDPPELSGLGVEPFDEAFTADSLHEQAHRSDRALKTFLLDQKVVVGVGNIYASEALWQAGLHPHKRARTLSREGAHALHRAIVETLARAIEKKGTTLSDYVDAYGETGWNQLTLQVYDRAGEACARCGKKVKSVVTQARTTFYCPGCQRR